MFLVPLLFSPPFRVDDDYDSFPWTVTLTGHDTLTHGSSTTGSQFGDGDTLTFQAGSTSVLRDANGHVLTPYKGAATALIGRARNYAPSQSVDAAEIVSGAIRVKDDPGYRRRPPFTNGRPIMIRTHNTTTAVKGTDFVVTFVNASSVNVKDNDPASPVTTIVDATSSSAAVAYPIDQTGSATIVPYSQPVSDAGTLSSRPGIIPLPPHSFDPHHYWVFLPRDGELLDKDGDTIPQWMAGNHPATWIRLQEGQSVTTSPPLDANGQPTTFAVLETPSGFRITTLERSVLLLGVRNSGLGHPRQLTFLRGAVWSRTWPVAGQGVLEVGSDDATIRLDRHHSRAVRLLFTPSIAGSPTLTRLQVDEGSVEVMRPWKKPGQAPSGLGHLQLSGKQAVRVNRG